MARIRGRITIEYTFWCGHMNGCAIWFSVISSGKKGNAIKIARSEGWVLTRAFGWQCPTHAG